MFAFVAAAAAGCPVGWTAVANTSAGCYRVTKGKASHRGCDSLCGHSATLACVASEEERLRIYTAVVEGTGYDSWIGNYQVLEEDRTSVGWRLCPSGDTPAPLDFDELGPHGHARQCALWRDPRGSRLTSGYLQDYHCQTPEHCVCEYGAAASTEYTSTMDAHFRWIYGFLWRDFFIILGVAVAPAIAGTLALLRINWKLWKSARSADRTSSNTMSNLFSRRARTRRLDFFQIGMADGDEDDLETAELLVQRSSLGQLQRALKQVVVSERVESVSSAFRTTLREVLRAERIDATNLQQAQRVARSLLGIEKKQKGGTAGAAGTQTQAADGTGVQTVAQPGPVGALAADSIDAEMRAVGEERMATEQLNLARLSARKLYLTISGVSTVTGWCMFILGFGPIFDELWSPWGSLINHYYSFSLVPPGLCVMLCALLPSDVRGIRLAVRVLLGFFFSLSVLMAVLIVISATTTSGTNEVTTWEIIYLIDAFAAAVALGAAMVCTSMPRLLLQRAWLVLRLFLMGSAMLGAYEVVVAEWDLEVAIPEMVSSAGCALLFTPHARRRIQSALGTLTTRGQARSAAAVAAMVGDRSARRALSHASSNLRCLPFDRLQLADLQTNHDTGLGRYTLSARMGMITAFVSHSWSDPGEEKWRALSEWERRQTAERPGRPVTIWLDKACISQASIDDCLATLPVNLAACRYLVILLGPTYLSRLWCVIEIFTWLQMGGSLDRIHVLPLVPLSEDAADGIDQPPSTTRQGNASSGPSSVQQQPVADNGGSMRKAAFAREPSKTAIAGSFIVKRAEASSRRRAAAQSNETPESRVALIGQLVARFDVRKATCFRTEERERLIGIIESTFGDYAPFNLLCRRMLHEKLQAGADELALDMDDPGVHGTADDVPSVSPFGRLRKMQMVVSRLHRSRAAEPKTGGKGAGESEDTVQSHPQDGRLPTVLSTPSTCNVMQEHPTSAPTTEDGAEPGSPPRGAQGETASDEELGGAPTTSDLEGGRRAAASHASPWRGVLPSLFA